MGSHDCQVGQNVLQNPFILAELCLMILTVVSIGVYYNSPAS